MDAVILAAGIGLRLRPLTLKTPKPLLTIGGKPIIAHTLDALPPEVDRIVIVVKYLSEQIVAAVGTKWRGIPVTYVHQEKLGGTGDALTVARVALWPGKFLVLMGDDVYDPRDLADMTKHHYAILVREVSDPKRFGSIELDAQGNCCAIREAGDGQPKPPYLVNCAVYTLDQRYFELPPKHTPKGEIGLPQTMAQLAHLPATQGGPQKIAVVRAREWYSVGTPEEFDAVRNLSKFK
ncbi:MAG: nucleotidyltransferase family protein [Parcubacteria group bacterium]